MTTEKEPATKLKVKPRLLLVEDDFATSQALRLLLSRRGWNVDVASTLEQALSRINEQPQWLVIDLMLPDGDGTTLLKKIRDEKLNIRVAVTTGSSDSIRLKMVKALRPELLMIKPIDLEVLLKALQPDQDCGSQ